MISQTEADKTKNPDEHNLNPQLNICITNMHTLIFHDNFKNLANKL